MTHDPLCTTVLNSEMSEAFCNCDLIARVREDERWKVNEAWEEMWSRRSGEYEANGFGLGLAAASPWTNEEATTFAAHYEAKGQRDEREACIADVYRTCGHTKYEGCAPCAHDDAVAAIRAREEQT